MRILVFATVAALLFSCNQSQSTNGPKINGSQVAEADKIVATYHYGPVHWALEYEITVTADAIQIDLKAHKKISKTYPFTTKKFDKLLASFKNLRVKGKTKSFECDGSGSRHLIFYKDGEKILSADDYECKEDSRNYTGAELSLVYLIPDYDELVAAAKKARRQNDDEEYENEGWTASEKKQYMKECVRMTEAIMGKEINAQSYCSCMMGKLQTAFPTKEAADNGSSDKVVEWTDECSKQ
jgi:hypothetical protein